MRISSRVFGVQMESLFALGLLAATAGCGSSSNDGQTGTPTPQNDASVADANQGGGEDANVPDTSVPDGAVNGVIAVPLTVCDEVLAYVAPLTVGTQTFQALIDTGSTTLGVAGKGCSTCAVSPLYTPGPSAADQNTPAEADFGSGSWTGEVYQDTVGFQSDPNVPLKFVSIQTATGPSTQQGFFAGTCGGKPYQALMGFDRALAAVKDTNGFFDQFVAAKSIPNVFATKLCDTGGTLWLGGFDSTATTSPPQYVPFTADLFSSGYYTVALKSITIGGGGVAAAVANDDGGSDAGTTNDAGSSGVTVPVATGSYTDSVLDTGTSLILIGTAANTALTEAITASPAVQSAFGEPAGTNWMLPDNNGNPGCAATTMTKQQLDAALPSISFEFASGVTIQALPTESYLFPAEGGYCTSFYPAAQAANSFPFAAILGSPFLRSQVVIFDRANAQVGFAPHSACTGE